MNIVGNKIPKQQSYIDQLSKLRFINFNIVFIFDL